MESGFGLRKDLPSSPALSLSLAGVFRNAAAAEEGAAEAGEESGGGGAAGFSSENTGPGRSEEDGEDEEEEVEEGGGRKKKRKIGAKYHRHTAEQIKVMEAVFRETPHPDEIQRQQLSKQLGLAPRQVKFWFQNRRTQIKAIQERHENTLLKAEIEKLREENQYMREAMKRGAYAIGGDMTSSRDGSSLMTEEQQLRVENLKLKSEIEKLRSLVGRLQQRSCASSPMSEGQEPRAYMECSSGLYGLDEAKMRDVATAAMDELMKMASLGDPLWITSVETGREILNYDNYAREFPRAASTSPAQAVAGKAIEASRESGIVFLDISRLAHAFMDVNEWRDMFPTIISRASVVDVIVQGDGQNKDGLIQLMYAEYQLPTPLVATRESHFLRYCKRHGPDRWAVVDISLDHLLDDSSTGMSSAGVIRCRKLPSGCVMQDTENGHCKVTWVEHTEWQLKGSATHTLFRPVVASGRAFGARRWIAMLQLQCERRVFFMATNVPTRDCNGVPTLAGRRSLLSLAQRMMRGFCGAIGASGGRKWKKKAGGKGGEEMRVWSRKNMGDPGEPAGVIFCAASSIWLPVLPHTLFQFLREESRRNEWDVMFNGATSMSPIATIVKGQDRGNSVVVLASDDNRTRLLQDSCTTTSASESTVVFAAVDAAAMQSVMAGCNSDGIPILPSGFSILPDGLDGRPSVITSWPAEDAGMHPGGSLLTVAIQVLAEEAAAADPADAVSSTVSCTLQNIRTAMQCDDW